MDAHEPSEEEVQRASDGILDYAQNITSDRGLVLKAIMVFDYIDSDGERHLNYVVSKDMAVWDLHGLLMGVLDLTGETYRRE